MINFIERYRTYIGIFLVVLILIGAGILLWDKKKNQDSSADKVVSGEIRVDIEGAVANPGVYKLFEGAIVEDLINEAGGLSDKVDGAKLASDLNRAQKLRDGDKIMIPLMGEVAGTTSTPTTSAGGTTVAGKVNINSATAEQLDTLPGIGPAYAARIIQYRESNGAFGSIEEIKEVSGIGDATFGKIKDLITI